MAKRFTDTNKWREPFFRKLSDKAKLAWIYLCDECDMAGVLKIDWDLASFQLGFKVNAETLSRWFPHKIHFLSSDKIVILTFFKFQYGESKNSWSAKVRAKEKLEKLGFTIDNNNLLHFSKEGETTVPPQWGDSHPTRLYRVIGKGIGKEDSEKISLDASEPDNEKWVLTDDLLEAAYKNYPRKMGKKDGHKRLRALIKSPEAYADLLLAIDNYNLKIAKEKTEPQFIKHWSTFANNYEDYLELAPSHRINKHSLKGAPLEFD